MAWPLEVPTTSTARPRALRMAAVGGEALTTSRSPVMVVCRHTPEKRLASPKQGLRHQRVAHEISSVAQDLARTKGETGAAAGFEERGADDRERPPRVDEVVDEQYRLPPRCPRSRTRPRRWRTAGASSRAPSAASSRASSRRPAGRAGQSPRPAAPRSRARDPRRRMHARHPRRRRSGRQR